MWIPTLLLPSCTADYDVVVILHADRSPTDSQEMLSLLLLYVTYSTQTSANQRMFWSEWQSNYIVSTNHTVTECGHIQVNVGICTHNNGC